MFIDGTSSGIKVGCRLSVTGGSLPNNSNILIFHKLVEFTKA
jgi:hypothetical protein